MGRDSESDGCNIADSKTDTTEIENNLNRSSSEKSEKNAKDFSLNNFDGEKQCQKLPYPKCVFFIVGNEFCERFCYYGMRTILSLYLVDILSYTEGNAKIIYHSFTMLAYFFPLVGAIISDSWLGKFKTIFYVSMIYAAGNVVLSLSAVDPLHMPKREISILGLFLIALGTGGIKPCVSAFGGDQFVVPEQNIQLERFFSMFYFSINAGSLISTFLTPELRENVHCFGNDSCYPLAFGIPGILMIVALIIFAVGKPLYKVKKPQGNIIVEVCKCIGHALVTKHKSGTKRNHWLDHATEKYGKKLVKDIKVTLKVLVVYIPLPVFWALYDQQGTAWTFQANRMDGNLGFYTLLPDQMQVVNPLLILIFIPLFSYGVYPLLAKCNLLKSSLQKMVVGGFLAAVAFGVSALISMKLEATYPVLPSAGNAQVRLYNTLPCDMTMNSDYLRNETVTIPSLSYVKFVKEEIKGNLTVNGLYTCGEFKNIPLEFRLEEAHAVGIFFMKNEKNELGLVNYTDAIDKPEDGLPRIRILSDKNIEAHVYDRNGKDILNITVLRNYTGLSVLNNPGNYSIFGTEGKLDLGGIYTILVSEDKTNVTFITITEPNSINMLWLLPQYIIITVSEILFSITGLEFSYSQAPVTMKSVLTAAFLLTDAIGNAIIVIIESIEIFDKQSLTFLLYTGLMVLDMLLFAYLAYHYEYVVFNDDDDDDSEQEDKSKAQSENGNKVLNGVDNPSYNSTDERF